MSTKLKCILCVEDEPEMIDLMRLILGRKGFEVKGASGGVEGLRMIRQDKPDLVLLDWELPGMPAEELLALIRQQCPCLGVVFMSGKLELRSMALLAGADIFAYKADPPEKLLEQIREFIIEKHKP